MTIDQDQVAHVTVLRPVGRLDSGVAPRLEEALLPHARQPGATVLVDMAEVDYVGSAGIRVLLLAVTRMRRTGGRLCLCSAQEHVMDVLEISGLGRAFEMFRSRDTALRELADTARG